MLSPVVRGAVSNPERATQERDFTGLLYGNITPTDIDGFMEVHNKCYVFYEAKHVSAPPLDGGQKWAFERLCDDLQKAQKPTIYIVFEHDTPPDKKIDFSIGKVVSYKYLGQAWRTPKLDVMVKAMQDWFLRKHDR